jgi:hypothetical protein
MMIEGLMNIGETVHKARVNTPLQAFKVCSADTREDRVLMSSPKLGAAEGISAEEWNFIIDEFMEGAKVDEYLPDLQVCKDMSVFGYLEFVYMGSFFAGKDPANDPTVYSSLYNMTAVIGEMATWIRSCYKTEQDIQVNFATEYIAEFSGAGNYALTWVSNLLGRTLDITKRIEEIQEAELICDLISIAWSYGRLTWYSFYVEPMPTESLMGPVSFSDFYMMDETSPDLRLKTHHH